MNMAISSPPLSKASAVFIWVSSIILFISAAAKLAGAGAQPGLFSAPAPPSFFFSREFLILASLMELAASAFLMVTSNQQKKLLLLAGFGGFFLVLHLGLLLAGQPNACHCFGSYGDAIPLSPKLGVLFGYVGLAWFLVGSVSLLALERAPAVESSGGVKAIVCSWAVGAALCGLLFNGLHAAAQRSYPPRLDAAMKEIFSITGLRASPVANHCGDKIIYAWNDAVGVSFSLLNLTTLASTQIGSLPEADYAHPKAFDLYGWSPDDRCLAYSAAVAGDQPRRRVFLCDGATGTKRASFDLEGVIQQGIWLTTNSLVFLDEKYGLSLFNLEPENRFSANGGKGLIQLREVHIHDNSYSLARISDHSFAYVSNGVALTCDLIANTSTAWLQTTNTTIEWLDYDSVRAEFLFCQSDGNPETDRFLFRFQPAANPSSPERVTDFHTFKGQWIEHGPGFVFVGTKGNANYLAVETGRDHFRTNLFTGGHVRSYSTSPDGEKVYAVASIGPEPLGLWEYDITAKKLRALLPDTKPLFQTAKVIVPINAATRPEEGNIRYYYLPPPDLQPGKKYPAIIDRPTDSRFDEGAQFLANAGIFYVSANRHGLASSDRLATAAADILAVYHDLTNNQSIDPARIFLTGRSSSTSVAVDLAEVHPELWRGLILLAPTTFPKNPLEPNFPATLVSIGDHENIDFHKAALRLAAAGCAQSIPVQIRTHPLAGHWFEGDELTEDRYRTMVKFILQP